MYNPQLFFINLHFTLNSLRSTRHQALSELILFTFLHSCNNINNGVDITISNINAVLLLLGVHEGISTKHTLRKYIGLKVRQNY